MAIASADPSADPAGERPPLPAGTLGVDGARPFRNRRGRPEADVRPDQVAPFRPAILGIRGGTTAVSVALTSQAFADGEVGVVAWCLVVVAYNVFRIPELNEELRVRVFAKLEP